MTLELLKADVDAAAQQIDAAAEGVADTSPGSHLSGVGAAMAGSQSAGAATALAQSWDTSVSELRRDGAALADRMRAAADHLHAADEVVGTTFRRPMELAQ